MDWCEPTEEEKKAIHNALDLPIIAIIKGLSCEDRKSIYDSLAVKSEYMDDFMKNQEPWISDFKKYWGENHKKDPDQCPEFGTDFLISHEYERFRLYYAAKHPERVRIERADNKRALEFMIETSDAIRVSKLISALPK
jgi:hypothetical protein